MRRPGVGLFLILSTFLSCRKPENKPWQTTLPGITSQSSPRAVDLTGDGILDVVLGAGGPEWSPTETGIVALDGADGHRLWQRPARNQVVGSPVFQDITGDGTPDVFIGGRSAELQAIDGKTGELLWEFFKTTEPARARRAGWFNFFNAQWAPDQDGDGIRELLVTNGGDAAAPPGFPHRPTGRVMLLSAKTGKILQSAYMPDRRETYCSPLLTDFGRKAGPLFVVFGTGGETLPGHLYVAPFSDVQKGNLAHAVAIDSGKTKGFVAPPLLADLTGDGILDLLVNAVEGRTALFDGATLRKRWEVAFPGAEVYTMPTVGFFTGNDAVPDVFVAYHLGTFPDFTEAVQVLIDGKTGKVARTFRQGSFTYASPLTADLNHDGRDDALLVQLFDKKVNGDPKPYYGLRAYDFFHHNMFAVGPEAPGANFASTPWLGDLDGDGQLDLLTVGSPALVKTFPGSTTYQKPDLALTIRRLVLPVPARNVRLGGYMGNAGNGVCR